MPARYPYGAERVLVPAVTGRPMPPGQYPDSVGVVVHNVATIAAIADALREGLPLIRRPLTVAGGAVAQPCNLLVPVGTPIADVLKAVGLKEQPREIVMGGPDDGHYGRQRRGAGDQRHVGDLGPHRGGAAPLPGVGLPALRPVRRRLPGRADADAAGSPERPGTV